jgi:hypothetical protein
MWQQCHNSFAEHCYICSADKDVEESDEDVEEEQPVQTYEEAVTGFETGGWYVTWFTIDDAWMYWLTCQTKQTALLDYFRK